MAGHAQFSFDGVNDQLTHCAAPPLFYAHLDRMISGSKRTGALLTLVSISIPILSTLDQILSIAHVINQKMRREDLCGRLGHFQFVIVVSGSLSDGEKLLERIAKSLDPKFTSDPKFISELVQWNPGETSLEILYRLDREGELTV